MRFVYHSSILLRTELVTDIKPGIRGASCQRQQAPSDGSLACVEPTSPPYLIRPDSRIHYAGSIRTVKTTGTALPKPRMTPLQIAQDSEHTALYKALKPVFKFSVSDAVLEELELQFHELIEGEMSWPEGRVRLPELGVLREGDGVGWFPVRPGVNKEVGRTLAIRPASVSGLTNLGLLVSSGKEKSVSLGYRWKRRPRRTEEGYGGHGRRSC